MPINIPGLLVPFQLLLYPRLVVPHVLINDIRQLDFVALRKAGYRGAVFDKDNCLTLPHRDTIVPEIQEAWLECRKTFGDSNVLIVSNSAGTRLDPGGIQCESVAFHTGVPVLRHEKLKPSYSCITAIRDYFTSIQFPVRDEELIVVGDRIFTDVVMANRMRMRKHSHELLETAPVSGYEEGGTNEREKYTSKDHPQGPLAVWTTGVWEKEATITRWLERQLSNIVYRWTQNKLGPDGRHFIKQVNNKDSELIYKAQSE